MHVFKILVERFRLRSPLVFLLNSFKKMRLSGKYASQSGLFDRYRPEKVETVVGPRSCHTSTLHLLEWCFKESQWLALEKGKVSYQFPYRFSVQTDSGSMQGTVPDPKLTPRVRP